MTQDVERLEHVPVHARRSALFAPASVPRENDAETDQHDRWLQHIAVPISAGVASGGGIGSSGIGYREPCHPLGDAQSHQRSEATCHTSTAARVAFRHAQTLAGCSGLPSRLSVARRGLSAETPGGLPCCLTTRDLSVGCSARERAAFSSIQLQAVDHRARATAQSASRRQEIWHAERRSAKDEAPWRTRCGGRPVANSQEAATGGHWQRLIPPQAPPTSASARTGK